MASERNPPLIPDDDVLLEPHEVAVMFGVHESTVGRWADRGMIAHIRTPGGKRKYWKSSADALKAQAETMGM